MNKHAFLDGYVNKKKLGNILGDFLSDPALRLASYAPEALGVGGAGIGAMVGHKLSKDEDDSQEEKGRPEFGNILAGSLVGGGIGSFAGNAIKNRVKWSKIREVINKL